MNRNSSESTLKNKSADQNLDGKGKVKTTTSCTEMPTREPPRAEQPQLSELRRTLSAPVGCRLHPASFIQGMAFVVCL